MAEDDNSKLVRVPLATWELVKEVARIERRTIGQQVARLVEAGLVAEGYTFDDAVSE